MREHRPQQPKSRRWRRRRPSSAVVTLILILAGVATVTPAPAQDRGHDSDAEAERIAEALELSPGAVFADVGAGGGHWTVQLAERVGPDGHVFATEVEPIRLSEIRDRFEAEGLEGATIVLGYQDHAGLPPSCCDAVLLRLVYHHLREPGALNRSLFEALRPGGLLAILENSNGRGSTPPGVPQDRKGHGIAREIVTDELTEAGFELVRVEESDALGRGMYLALFRRLQGEALEEDPPGP